MSKRSAIQRNYSVSDAEMVLQSNVIRTLFIQDKADFLQFDSSFADPYSDNWATSISQTETIAKDAELIDQMTQLSGIVLEKVKESQDYYQKLKYYLEKAFTKNVAIQNEFGRNDYEKVRNSSAKLISFMQTLNNAVTKYSVQLLASGCSQEFLDKAATLRDELRVAENNQELFKKTRPVETQTRIETMVNCWNFAKNVCKAGKIIYSENAAKYNQYLLPGEAPKTIVVPEQPAQ